MSYHHGIYKQFFLDTEVIFSSHTMFINAATKEFTLVITLSQAMTLHSNIYYSYYKMVANVYKEHDNIFKNKTYSILIYQSFPFTLVQSFHSNQDGDVGQ